MLGGPLLLSEPCRCDFKHFQSPLSSLYSLPCGSASLLGIPPGCLDLCGRGRLVWTDTRECVGTHRTPCLRHNSIRHPLPPGPSLCSLKLGLSRGFRAPSCREREPFTDTLSSMASETEAGGGADRGTVSGEVLRGIRGFPQKGIFVMSFEK